MKLEPPDTHHFSAAQGWLGLGNLNEALVELAQLRPVHHEAPEVLELRWQILATARRWNEGLATAETLVARAPDCPRGWVHRAVSLYRLGSAQAAFDALAPALSRFPRDWVVRYDLACYACQLDRLTLARTWLSEALELGESERVKNLALEDPDLQVLWPEIPEY